VPAARCSVHAAARDLAVDFARLCFDIRRFGFVLVFGFVVGIVEDLWRRFKKTASDNYRYNRGFAQDEL
jgi:hypothetical protein